jgi:hypothetical protein
MAQAEMQLRDARIMRSMAADYRQQAEGTKDPGLRRQLAEMAVYCEKMAAAIEKLKAKEQETRGKKN